MTWYPVESTVLPEEQDLTSSSKYNFVRRDIVEVEREDEEGNPVTMYVYEEAKVLKEDWGLYIDTAQNTADIEYIAAMTDVDLEV